MKRILLIFLALLLANQSFSQGYTWISSYYYSYIEICVEFKKQTPISSFSYSDAMAYKTAQYENAWSEVNAVYGQMKRLQLLNKFNRAYLNTYRDNYLKQISDKAGQIDLSVPYNKSWVIENLTKPITSNKNIRNEIKFFAKLGKEIDFLEHQAFKFSKEQIGDIELKKKNISNFLLEYENVEPNSIQSLINKYNLNLIMMGESLE